VRLREVLAVVGGAGAAFALGSVTAGGEVLLLLLLCRLVIAAVCGRWSEADGESVAGGFSPFAATSEVFLLLRKLSDCRRFESALARRGMGAKRTSQRPQISFAKSIRVV